MTERPFPDMRLANSIFLLKSHRFLDRHKQEAEFLMKSIIENELAPLYKHVAGEKLPQIEFDEKVYESLRKSNERKIDELNSKIKDASESEDELALVEAWTNLGNFYALICDRENALKSLRKAFELAASAGSKIDILLTIIRIGFFFNDKRMVMKELETGQALIDKGGDWERKNRFKTYRGLYMMSIRQFAEAADALIDSFATFTCTELLTYNEVVGYGIVCGAFALSRVELKKRIVDSPEILSLMSSSGHLDSLSIMTNSLYTGEYATFLTALANIEKNVLQPFWMLAPHSAYFVREMRCKAYAQLLESYMALSLRSMAQSFGVSIEFLDEDLSRFIPRKKLNCVIDRVNGLIITNRPDTKNAQYQLVVKQGDALLTKLQKYSAAVRLYGADQQ